MAQVYLLTNGKNYKIGVASNLQRRIKSLSTGQDNPIEVVAISHNMPKDHAHFLERSIHKNCRQYRKQGEWFALPPFVANVVKTQLSSISALKSSI